MNKIPALLGLIAAALLALQLAEKWDRPRAPLPAPPPPVPWELPPLPEKPAPRTAADSVREPPTPVALATPATAAHRLELRPHANPATKLR